MTFLKSALLACSIIVGTVAAQADEVRIVVDQPLPPASARALMELREALASRGDQTVAADSPDASVPSLVVGLMDRSKAVDATLNDDIRQNLRFPESVLIWGERGSSKATIVAGHDDRGLAYALRDAARAISCTPRTKRWNAELTWAMEKPFLKVRNVSLHLFNADCEREWFFSEEFWRFYFQRLSLSRFNRCTLTFCDQTNYLCPPYAYLVEMPEYPSIKIADCTTEQRTASLKMLRRIAELADEYAIDFDLGIWMQGPVAKWAAPVQVTGLPEGLELAKYCALGLRRILEACPNIDGLQLRMNAEAGVPEDQQTAFYKPMFQALAAVQAKQRPQSPYRLELRYKGLTDETIRAAREEKLDVTVSTKFWAEHFGLPYHPTVVDSHYAKDRYSFGTLLKKPRDYRVTYQLWTVGSQRLTLWGDPEYCKRFAESCTLGGGEGFEVFAPLTNKGYGNKPGAWPVIKDPAYRVGKWEQERYWAFYLAFGRMGYNPNSSLDFWHREFRHRFGDAAKWIELAYREASQVLPLITTALLPSASEWYWWPEMDTGGDLATYSRIQTSDPGLFTSIRRWERTPGWRWEEWDAAADRAYRVSGVSREDGRESQLQLGERLGFAAVEIRRNWKAAMEATHPDDAEWRMTGVDLALLAGLAKYHGEKMHAAFHYAYHEHAANRQDHLFGALQSLTGTRETWNKIMTATDGIYHDHLVFGITPEMSRSKQGHHHSGHWRGRAEEIDTDIEQLRARTKDLTKEPGTFFPGFPIGDHLADVLEYSIEHQPATKFHADRPFELKVKTGTYFLGRRDEQRDCSGLTVHVRPLDQTQKWRAYKMAAEAVAGDGKTTWSVEIPADVVDSRFDLQYFFTTHQPTPRSLCWPRWEETQPYYVAPVETK